MDTALMHSEPTRAGKSSNTLTPLRPERIDILGSASEWEKFTASEWLRSGSPGIEDVDGAARSYDADDNKPCRVFVSDLPTTHMTKPGKKMHDPVVLDAIQSAMEVG